MIERLDGETWKAMVVGDIVGHIVRLAELIDHILRLITLIEEAGPDLANSDAPNNYIGA